MRCVKQADTVVMWAPAKVNLYLEILAKRADGYHEIETLMAAVSLYDTLAFKEESSGDILLCSDHPDLSTGPDNLVYRAAALLRQRSGCERGVRIDLTKRIPLAAGLAGGSSDAAATLAGLNELWSLGLSPADLAGLAAEIGSDVPFFFSTPAAWCTGRGERVTPLTPGKPLLFVLVCPPARLATADVYRNALVPKPPQSGANMRRAVVAGDIEAIGRCLHNRLQPVAERICPLVADYRQRLEQLRPAGLLMSGSGASLFALCRDHDETMRIAQGLPRETEEGARPFVCTVSSCF